MQCYMVHLGVTMFLILSTMRSTQYLKFDLSLGLKVPRLLALCHIYRPCLLIGRASTFALRKPLWCGRISTLNWHNVTIFFVFYTSATVNQEAISWLEASGMDTGQTFTLTDAGKLALNWDTGKSTKSTSSGTTSNTNYQVWSSSMLTFWQCLSS